MKPVLFITGQVPAYRVGAFAALDRREGIEVAMFGGRLRHGGPASSGELPFPHAFVDPRGLRGLARSGRYRAVVVSTAGRLAPLAGWSGARSAGLPVLLWASLWAQPRTVAHALGYPLLRRLYRTADAVVTYGPHVSRYVQARGARNVHVAAQSVDNDFWRAPADESAQTDRPAAAARFLFVGRAAPEKGLGVLLDAWRGMPGEAALVLVGDPGGAEAAPGSVSLGPLGPEALRKVYADADVLVVPSIRTRTFREPWGLVVNEAMNQRVAVIASNEVGAAAGGLVRHGANGLIVPAGDAAALRAAIERLAADGPLRARLGGQGAQDVLAYSHEAWAAGFSAALSTVGLSRARW